ncbi:MAG: hypothetical protein QNK26_01445, partial [Moritella sp.]|uniref:hypothetical protein n=1 Tax=Moritella sp. TaxID=78556 RepID=UPI0029B2912E
FLMNCLILFVFGGIGALCGVNHHLSSYKDNKAHIIMANIAGWLGLLLPIYFYFGLNWNGFFCLSLFLFFGYSYNLGKKDATTGTYD